MLKSWIKSEAEFLCTDLCQSQQAKFCGLYWRLWPIVIAIFVRCRIISAPISSGNLTSLTARAMQSSHSVRREGPISMCSWIRVRLACPNFSTYSLGPPKNPDKNLNCSALEWPMPWPRK